MASRAVLTTDGLKSERMSKEKSRSGRGGDASPPESSGRREEPSGRLVRVRQGAILAGVCGGLARYSQLPVSIWRAIFAAGFFALGLGGLAYLVLWLALRREAGVVPPVAPLFRKIDWWTFAATTLIVFIGYLFTLAPDLTLEDSGELAVGSFYAGVPHPPGYPVWTLYTWLFTVLVPFSNIAWRVALSSAVAGAFSSGLVALLASRGSSMFLESIEELKGIDRRWENALCMATGYVAGMLIGFNGFMWSQAVIVEVYPFSLLSFMFMMVFLLRWIHAPSQMRYAYWALFFFGISFTNHQTLILAAMGIEVAIAAADRKLGRDLFLWNSIIFVVGLVLFAGGHLQALAGNKPLFRIYIVIGLASIAACVVLAMQTEGLGSHVFHAFCLGMCWALGALFYFFMPVASATNPPMNWGYARTWEGFVHAFTRGQYERTNPTTSWDRFFDQMNLLFTGAVEEFNLVYLFLALIPFVFFLRMQRRERAWLLGLITMYLGLGVLLIVLMNVSPDRQSREMTRVFFTASHVMIALCVAYGMSILGGFLATQYAEFRRPALAGAALAAAFAFYSVTVVYQPDKESLLSRFAFGLEPTADPLARFTALFTLGLAAVAVLIFLIARRRAPLAPLLGLFFLMPFESVFSHWSDNEQRGHLFGYWFGHDMFTPPFGIYPPMARDTILFGGTDPGRFCPTYMIFCESFIPARCKPRDPEFDRRDVYIITQNALADGTYLNYIRAHYNRSAQKDPYFFQDMVRSNPARPNLLGQILLPADRWLMAFGRWVENRRRAEGVYPPVEIHTPSLEDHANCMSEYFADAQRRLQAGQLRPGEDVRVGEDGRLQVAGQVSVMAINGLLTKVIFDKNPTNEFYVEESFPLDWMFPHLEPYGIIMRINRQPLAEISEEKVQKDHEFWCRYSERLIGNWITYDTPVKEICDFAMRVHERRDVTGFTGDRKFVRDDQAQKSFSKLRSSIGGVYTWRVANARTNEEQQRMLREAEFAFKQAFAFCPYSPEAVYRYSSLLVGSQRFDEALLLAETCLRFDRENSSIQGLVKHIQDLKGLPRAAANADQIQQMQQRLAQLEQDLKTNPSNAQAVFDLASIYLQLQRTNAALELLDRLVDLPSANVNTLLSVANAYAQLQQGTRLENVLNKLVQAAPESPEAWYDLASTRAVLGKPNEALAALTKALALSDARRAREATSRDLRADARTNQGFLPVRSNPEFQRLTAGP